MWFLSQIILYKFNAFSILTKHLPHTVAVTLADCNSKTSTNFFFLLHNFTNRRFVLTVDLSVIL